MRRFLYALSLLILSVSCKRESQPEQAAEEPGTRTPGALSQPPTSTSSAEPQPPPEPSKAKRPRNVLLITVDSLRADMPWTGYPKAIAPFLTELAAQSVVYENAYSVSSYTSKSVSAMLTGKYPSTLYRSGSFFASFSPANVFITELLQAKGIRTFAWHGHMYFGRGKGLDQGFDSWELVPGISFNSETDPHVTSDKMTDLGIALFSKPENTSGQFFAWAHYMDPHDQYILHKEAPDFGRNNRGRYDSEVYFTDLHLKRLFEVARQQPWYEDTAIIVSADHGEAFGDHGMHKHAFELWEVLTRVPLLVKVPGWQPRRISARRSLIDLAPTILAVMGVEAPPGLHGTSLVAELSGQAEATERPYVLLELPEDSHNAPRRALIVGDYKLYVRDDSGQAALYNLKEDPGELRDISRDEPGKVAELRAKLKEVYAGLPTVVPYGGMKLRTGRRAKGPSGP
jgi:choline-sulfatase